MLVKNFGQETREDDIGIGACEVLLDESGLLVKEFLSATAMVSQHNALAKSSAHRDS